MKKIIKIMLYSMFYFFIYSTIFMKSWWIHFFSKHISGYELTMYYHVLGISIFYFICLFIQMCLWFYFKKLEKN